VEQFINELEMIKTSNQEKQKVGDLAQKWISPPKGFTKVNVDVTISKNSSKASIATVARDKNGNFLGALSLILEGCTDPEITEVVACHEGLALASDLNLLTL